jgi:predicted amidophosphoribosyltransferase
MADNVVPTPVSALRKGTIVMMQGHPCKITDITTTKMLSASSGRHPDIICDGCKQDIIDVRYVCLDCVDFDLCELCEEKQEHAENKHVFAKIRNSKQVSLGRYRYAGNNLQ